MLISSTTEPGRRSVEETALDEDRVRGPRVRDHRHHDVGAGELRGIGGDSSAPPSTSGAQRSGVRFQTRSGKPAASRLRAIARPIRPIPANPTVTSACGSMTFLEDGRLVKFTGSAWCLDKDLSAVHHVHLPRHVVGLG